jgi:hypothetical protein
MARKPPLGVVIRCSPKGHSRFACALLAEPTRATLLGRPLGFVQRNLTCMSAPQEPHEMATPSTRKAWRQKLDLEFMKPLLGRCCRKP